MDASDLFISDAGGAAVIQLNLFLLISAQVLPDARQAQSGLAKEGFGRAVVSHHQGTALRCIPQSGASAAVRLRAIRAAGAHAPKFQAYKDRQNFVQIGPRVSCWPPTPALSRGSYVGAGIRPAAAFTGRSAHTPVSDESHSAGVVEFFEWINCHKRRTL